MSHELSESWCKPQVSGNPCHGRPSFSTLLRPSTPRIRNHSRPNPAATQTTPIQPAADINRLVDDITYLADNIILMSHPGTYVSHQAQPPISRRPVGPRPFI